MVYVVVVLFRCCCCACVWKYFYSSDLYARFLEARSHFRVKQRSLIVNSWTMSQPVCQQIDSQHFKINVKTAFVDLLFAYKSTCLFFCQSSLSCNMHKSFMQFSFDFSEIVHFQTTCSGIFINLFIWGKESLIIDHIN